MKPLGSYKISNRGRGLSGRGLSGRGLSGRGVGGPVAGTMTDAFPNPLARSELRTQRILESLRNEIVECGVEHVRVRRVFRTPREIYRLELELPQLGYQRTILLDRDALEELLEVDEVRAVVSAPAL